MRPGHMSVPHYVILSLDSIKASFSQKWYCACVMCRGHLVYPTRALSTLGISFVGV